MFNRRGGGFRYRLARFFMGRNGADTLYYIAFVLSFVSLILNRIFFNLPLWNILFFLLYLFFFGYAIFRLFSRNIYKRQKENAAVRRFFGKLFRPFRRLFLRIRDRKTHVFRKCPHCRATLRLSRIPGEHMTRCPSCGERFAVKVKK